MHANGLNILKSNKNNTLGGILETHHITNTQTVCQVIISQENLQEYIEKLSNQGVIEPSVSEWSAPPVLVRKNRSELRYCIDYGSLNAKTYKDSYSLHLFEDCLGLLYGKKLFCILDLCSGYYQIPLEKESRKKTSFKTRFGSVQWTRLPLGLCTTGTRSKGPCHWF